MAFSRFEYPERLSGAKALGAAVVGVIEPMFRSVQHTLAKSSVVRALEKFGEGSPQFNKALERLNEVSQHNTAHPSALISVPFVLAGELIEPDPNRNVPK